MKPETIEKKKCYKMGCLPRALSLTSLAGQARETINQKQYRGRVRKTPLVQVDGICQVDGIGVSILYNALFVGLQSLPLVILFFTFLDHFERMLPESSRRDVLGMARGGTLSLVVV
jgi:hypothetical protein